MSAIKKKKNLLIDLIDDTSDNEQKEKQKSHKSGMFVFLKRDKSNNASYKCLIDQCGKIIFHNALRKHVADHGPDAEAEYLSRMGLSESQTKLPFKALTAEEKKAELKEIVIEGTKENLFSKIAMFIVVCRLALRTVGLLVFREMIKTAINYGALNGKVKLEERLLPSRRTLTENVIEGENGILKREVLAGVEKLKNSAMKFGAQILFDGAKDSTGRSLEVFLLQAGPNQSLLFNALPHDNQKDHVWMQKVLTAIVNRKLDFEKMTFIEETESEPDEILVNDGNEEEEIGSKKQKKLVSHLKLLFDLTPYVFALGGDNAGVPIKAVVNLEDELGTLPFGCAGHAFSRSFQHICEIREINDNVISNAERLVDLFLKCTFIRELLRAECKKSLFRLIPTRFVSAVIVCQRIIDCKVALEVVVDSLKYKNYSAKMKLELRQHMKEVKELVHDAIFWDWLNFFVKMSVGYVVAVRCLDGAKSGSVCIVYKMWEMLSSTVATAFKEENNKELATRSLFEKVSEIILLDWEKFHFPIYSAGYLLCPHFYSEIQNLFRKDVNIGRALREETLRCCVSICRRFERDGSPRENILANDDETLIDIRIELKQDIDNYVNGSEPFEESMFQSDRMTSSPSNWYLSECPETLLRSCAMKICSLSPSTTPVERTHKVHKMQRTKYRNRLGYARALGLNFICCENIFSQSTSMLDWKTVKHYRERFEELSTEDRTFLEKIQVTEEEKAKDHAQIEEEEQIFSVEALEADQVFGTNSTTEELTTVLNEDQASESEVNNVSSRGRVIRRRIFENYWLTS